MKVGNSTMHMEHICYGRLGRGTLELFIPGAPAPVSVPPNQQQAVIDRLLRTGIFAKVEGYLIHRYRISLITVQGDAARIFFSGDVKPLYVHIQIAQPLIDDIEFHENPTAFIGTTDAHEAAMRAMRNEAFSDTDEVPEEPEMPPVVAEAVDRVVNEIFPPEQPVDELPAPEEKKSRKKKAGA